MSKDYQAIDEALDDEIRKMYGQDAASDSPSSEGTEPQSSSAAETDPGTSETEQQTQTEPQGEPTVPESRYKEAVRAMGRAQEEAAELRKTLSAKDARIAELESQLAAQPEQPQGDPSAIEEYYPEVAPYIQKIEALEKQLAAVKGDIGSVQQVTNRFQAQEAMTAQERHNAEIYSAHPDADTLVNSDAFNAWAASQAPIIQYALNQGSAKDVVAALNLYRAETGKPAPSTATGKPDKLEAARAAASPTVKGSQHKPEQKQTFTQAQIAKMSREEFMRNEAAIDEALARGEIY